MLDLCLSHVSVMWYGGKVPNIVLCLMTISAVRVHGVPRVTHSTSFPDTCFPGLAIGQRLSWWASVPMCSSPIIAAGGKYVTSSFFFCLFFFLCFFFFFFLIIFFYHFFRLSLCFCFFSFFGLSFFLCFSCFLKKKFLFLFL